MDQEQNAHIKNEIVEWIKAILIAGVLVVVIRMFIFQPFVVDGPSMRPNFYTGERLIVNKLIYSIHPPRRGEVIVFLAPEGKDYIKRVIALPGETIKVDGDDVYINGKKIAEPYIADAIKEAHKTRPVYNFTRDFKYVNGKLQAVTVPKDHVFVMGDNRPDSKDSRYEDVGFVPYDKIIGRADFVFWPLKKIHLINHY
ncbi:MAG TPA: signal peptidase I [Bacilli bacterium]